MLGVVLAQLVVSLRNLVFLVVVVVVLVREETVGRATEALVKRLHLLRGHDVAREVLVELLELCLHRVELAGHICKRLVRDGRLEDRVGSLVGHSAIVETKVVIWLIHLTTLASALWLSAASGSRRIRDAHAEGVRPGPLVVTAVHVRRATSTTSSNWLSLPGVEVGPERTTKMTWALLGKRMTSVLLWRSLLLWRSVLLLLLATPLRLILLG